MIELTEQQAQALETPAAVPPRVVNPRTNETFVLLRVDEDRALRVRLPPDGSAVQPQDEWERRRFGAAVDCGVSVPDAALSSDGLYE